MFNRFIYRAANTLRSRGVQFKEEEDPRVQKMMKAIRQAGGIAFRIEVQDGGHWVAESTTIDGIITGGIDYPHDVGDMIRDAIFTYFEIPPHLCNDTLIREQGEIARVEERVYA